MRILVRLLCLEMALAAAPGPGAAPVTGRPVQPVDRYDGLIATYSASNGMDPRFVKALIAAESDFQARAVSRSGALGLMQVMPRTAEMAGAARSRMHEPEENIRVGTAFLNELFSTARKRYGLKATRLQEAPVWVQRRVLAAYHAGPRMLYRDRWPRPTRNYVGRVMKLTKSPHLKLTTRL
jgi:soluble lytic murein transglycosylase-like protein